MSTTDYTELDLINKVVIDNSLSNCNNIGGPDPSVNMTGSFSDNAFVMTGAQINNIEQSAFSYQLFYDIDHASPVSPVPSNAQITRVTITMPTSGPAASDNSSITMPNEGPIGFHGGHAVAITNLACSVLPIPVNTALGTVTNINDSNSGSSINGVGPLTGSSSISPAANTLGFDIDYTTNPGGLYPLGYATYAQFIADFSNILFSFVGYAQAGAQWLAFSPPDHPTDATGSVSGSVSFAATNFQMEVTWNVPFISQWTPSPSTLILPDNVITITRPEPPAGDDTQQIEALYLNGHKIEPNDPWVIYWLRLTISIHLIIPDLTDSDTIIIIEADLVGTQFSGRVTLGTLTVEYADLSGIYEFDITAHSDQLYTRTTTSTTVTTQTVAIPAPFFVTAFLDNDDTDILHYTGTRMRVTGQGSLKQIFQSLDYINTEQLANTTLRTSNNVNPFTLANFIDQECALRVYMDTLDDYMNVSQLIIFPKPLWSGYPQ